MRVLMIIADTLHYSASGVTTAVAVVIGTLGAITATWGNTAAFAQNNIKRLLAYSSIAHAGYMLCALSLLVKSPSAGAFTPAGPVAQTILLYLAVYLFMNLGAFTAAGVIYRQTGSENINDYAGLGRRAPLLAAAMFCCLVSLIGLPPFAGFVAKLNVLWILFLNGSWWWILIVAIGINTILSAFYYFRVVRAMYLTDNGAPSMPGNILGTGIASVCAFVLLAMLILFGPMSKLTSEYGKIYGTSSEKSATSATMPVAQAAP
jgi:NADH-quinone oxidoreductase subunit N